MALSLQDPVQGKRRFFHAVAVSGSAAVNTIAINFFTWLMTQVVPTPQLQTVEFSALSSTSVVIANVACHLYVVVLSKPTTTAGYFKGSDNATTASSSAPEVSLRQNAVETDVLLFPKGLALTEGFAIRSDTTASGGTGSGTDGASGVVLLGA